MATLSISRIPFSLLLFLTLLSASGANNQTSPLSSSSSPASEFVPVEKTQYRVMTVGIDAAGGNRRRLAPFQLCLLCKCCPANSTIASNCSSMPCCFGIDCQLPDKPFGVCAFVPKTCSCNTCGRTN
ncbi:hypothetical protein H6P81_014730 [Aristolochia fimbriata]|uniref:DUF7866 domain-containing protein n=1 Tax=Aristolochia fimbriata TaxID=158543 RepID=A0AAV7E398_ARIFI|nr:hypothetical protein H6P81_014730 [Aristolochia fimbriata]